MFHFLTTQSISDFQKFIQDVYSLPDDRLFSLSDLISNQERFTMRALKGIRKGDKEKLKLNLLIAFSWAFAIANRLKIDIENSVWKRFPYVCSYCIQVPCQCKKIKQVCFVGSATEIKADKREKIVAKNDLRPKDLVGFQKMFEKIYPSSQRNLIWAGVHLAEEMGELSESIHVFLGEHKEIQFASIQEELADFFSCVFGVANSAKIDMAKELARMYSDNCHICHEAPCCCKFSFVAKLRT